MDNKNTSYIKINLPSKDFLIPELGLFVSNSVLIDWGDGGLLSSCTGKDIEIVNYIPHKYKNPGEYTIQIINGKFTFDDNFNGECFRYMFFHGANKTETIKGEYVFPDYEQFIKDISLGENFIISNEGGHKYSEYLIYDRNLNGRISR